MGVYLVVTSCYDVKSSKVPWYPSEQYAAHGRRRVPPVTAAWSLARPAIIGDEGVGFNLVKKPQSAPSTQYQTNHLILKCPGLGSISK